MTIKQEDDIRMHREMRTALKMWEDIAKAIMMSNVPDSSMYGTTSAMCKVSKLEVKRINKTLVLSTGHTLDYGYIHPSMYGVCAEYFKDGRSPYDIFERVPSAYNAQQMVESIKYVMYKLELQAIKDSTVHWEANKALMHMNGTCFNRPIERHALMWYTQVQEVVYPHGENEFTNWVNTIKPRDTIELRYGNTACSLCSLFASTDEEYDEYVKYATHMEAIELEVKPMVPCTGCPLKEIGKACVEDASPWMDFHNDPSEEHATLMIRALEEAENKWVAQIADQKEIVFNYNARGTAYIHKALDALVPQHIMENVMGNENKTEEIDTEVYAKYRAIDTGAGYTVGDVFDVVCKSRHFKYYGDHVACYPNGFYTNETTEEFAPLFSDEQLEESHDFEKIPTIWEPKFGEDFHVILHYPPRVVTLTRYNEDGVWAKHRNAMDYFRDIAYAYATLAEIEDMDRQLRTPEHINLYVKHMEDTVAKRSAIDRQID